MRIYYWGIAFGLCLLTACDDVDAIFIPEERAEAEVTVVCSINGPGDNGYNDAALRGVIGFGQRTGTQL